MKIAILGWGSLIWDPRELNLAAGWQEGGPVLPIEFSRISADGRLTLAIDERNGVYVSTRYATSSLTDLDESIADLQRREGTSNRNRIGSMGLNHNRQNPGTPSNRVRERIRAWAEHNDFDAVIWTALEANFDERTGERRPHCTISTVFPTL